MLSNHFSKPVYQFIKASVASIALLSLLTACASQPITPQQTAPKPIEQKLTPYNKVEALPEPQRSNAALNNAALAAKKKQYALSESYLLLATLSENNAATQLTTLNVAAELSLYTAQTDRLATWLDANISAIANTPELNAASKRVLATLAIRNGDYRLAAKRGLTLSNTNSFGTSDALQLWRALQALTLSEAKSLQAQQPVGSLADGWAQLAVAYLNNGSTLQQQTQQLSAWQNQWINHPANTLAANDIDTIYQRSQRPLDTAIAALPLTGRLQRAGKAIQAAMLAAHLDRPQFKQLIFINSADHENSDSLLPAIQALSPSVIIGPLDKNKAEGLALNTARIAPMVSLNTFDSDQAIPQTTYQMGLNIEDEAAYLAQVTPTEDKRALLISTNNRLSARAADAFTQAWLIKEDASLISLSLASSDDFSKNIEAGFLLTDANARQTKLENIFIEKMETNPRRRKDFDVIILAGTAQEARSINPLLAYHYAGDVPVFSPSIIFDGQQRSVANSDLNGIIFSDTPWAIASHSLKPQLADHVKGGGTPSKNLHALGIDAYYLAARSGLWKTDRSQSFNGVSGQLLISSTGEIIRRPALALITKRGVKPYTPPPEE